MLTDMKSFDEEKEIQNLLKFFTLETFLTHFSCFSDLSLNRSKSITQTLIQNFQFLIQKNDDRQHQLWNGKIP
jgi:hypothetical protein